jgi:Asp-tRNA(Asn)/Glu-tRNA(Gln) amidotransferase A subunit family amidase
VADGMVPLALGTQTGGSTIRPAAFCGTYALKPTWGSVPFDGIKGFSPPLDTVGLFGRSAEDLVLLAQAYRLLEEAPKILKRPLRLGICRSPSWKEAEAEAAQVFESLVQKLSLMGMECRSVEFDSEFSAINRWQDEVMQNGGRFAFLPEALMAPHALHDDFKAKLNNHLGLKGSAIRHALNQIDRCRIQFEGFGWRSDLECARHCPTGAPHTRDGHVQSHVDGFTSTLHQCASTLVCSRYAHRFAIGACTL